MNMFDPNPVTIADLLDITALGALVVIVLFVGRYFVKRLEADSRFIEKLATDSTAAILHITQEYATLHRSYISAMQKLTDQIMNGQEQRRREHETLGDRVKNEHETTRQQVRGLRGRLGKVARDEIDN